MVPRWPQSAHPREWGRNGGPQGSTHLMGLSLGHRPRAPPRLQVHIGHRRSCERSHRCISQGPDPPGVCWRHLPLITPIPDPVGVAWMCLLLHHPHPRPSWDSLDVSPPSIAPSQTKLGFAGCFPTPITPILQPVRACWMWPSVTPHPAGAHLQPLEPLQPSSWGKATVWGHHRRWDAGRTRGHALSHHPVTGTTLTPALSSAPWTGMGTAHPQPVRPQELEVSPSPSPTYLRPPCAPHGLARLQPYKAGAEPHAPQPPCVHRKSRSTLPLLTVNTSSGPARPWPPQCRGQVHPVPFSPKWGPPRSPRCPQPGHPAG